MEQYVTGGKRILLVEDEPVISRVCSRTLSREGHDVICASDGQAALELVKKLEV